MGEDREEEEEEGEKGEGEKGREKGENRSLNFFLLTFSFREREGKERGGEEDKEEEGERDDGVVIRVSWNVASSWNAFFEVERRYTTAYPNPLS